MQIVIETIFEEPIKAGQKRQCIVPAKSLDPPCKRGDRIELYCESLRGAEPISSVEAIEVAGITVTADYIDVDHYDIDAYDPEFAGMDAEEFAKAEGFDSYSELVGFLKRRYGLPTRHAPFEGWLIRW